MSSSESGNYEYVSARVRSRRAYLYTDEDYRRIVRMGPNEISRYMEETTYSNEVNEFGARYKGVDLIEYALNHNLASQFEDLLRWSEGELYEQISRYLKKFDAWNVKTILRGIYAKEKRETIRDDLIPAGEFKIAFLERLIGSESIEEFVSLLTGTMFGESLLFELRDYEDTQLLVSMENAIDRSYYDQLLKNMEVVEDPSVGLYTDFLRAEIDFRNVMNALRIAHSGSDISITEYYIKGGKQFTASKLSSAMKNVDEIAGLVRESRYGDQLSTVLEKLENSNSLIEFEHGLEAVLLAYCDRLSNVYPLSVCPVIAFVLSKEKEIENVRAIARGKEAGLSPEEIENQLVIL
jgi:V/A-type H+-transporting ATPase subunit C